MQRNALSDAITGSTSDAATSYEHLSDGSEETGRSKPRANRRRALLLAAAGGTAITIWRRPIIDTVLLPAHAQTSDGDLVGIGDPPVVPEQPVVPVCSRDERHVDAIPLQDANWSGSLFVPQFDPSNSRIGAALSRVTVQWRTDIEGEIGVENVEDPAGDARDTEIGAIVSAAMTLDGPTGRIGQTQPTATRSAMVPGFDGTIDFDGDSGRTFAGVTHSELVERVYTDAATLSLFTGSGAVEFRAESVASSSTFGSANTAARILTKSSTLVRVTYSCQ